MPDGYTDLLAEAARAAGLQTSAVVPPSDRHVELNGIRFHYLDWGNPHLPHLVLLHGAALCAHTWDLAALLLRDRYHVIALDLRGHGDTDWTPDAQRALDPAQLMLEDTRAFLDHLGYEGVALVGMSLGGINAIRFAAEDPDGLDALVIVDVAPESLLASPRAVGELERATSELEEFEVLLESARRFLPERPEAQLRYSLLHGLRRGAHGEYVWKHDPSAQQGIDSAEARERECDALRAALREVRAPALVLRGAQSEVLAQDVAERMAKDMFDARLAVIPRARHHVHTDNPADFARALDRFLSDVLPEAGDD
jgi:esterase